jgi:hypothetical protein
LSLEGTFLLLHAESEKCLFGRCDEAPFRNHAVRIVADNSIVVLALLLMHSMLDAPEFFGRQIWQYGFDFSNRAHGI